MVKNLVRVLGLVIGLVILILMTPPAKSIEIGGNFQIRAFCVTEKAARALSDAVVKDNDLGYARIMADPSVACVDATVRTDLPALWVTLVRKAWSIVRADGKAFQFWIVRDISGQHAYIWSLIEVIKS
ncbi:MAG: hypothetical protein V3S55_15220 [Nitrospiraceae bacterium]